MFADPLIVILAGTLLFASCAAVVFVPLHLWLWFSENRHHRAHEHACWVDDTVCRDCGYIPTQEEIAAWSAWK